MAVKNDGRPSAPVPLDSRVKAQRTIQLKRTIAAIILACDDLPLELAIVALQAAWQDQKDRAYDQSIQSAQSAKRL